MWIVYLSIFNLYHTFHRINQLIYRFFCEKKINKSTISKKIDVFAVKMSNSATVSVHISCDIWYEYQLVGLKRDAFLCRLSRQLNATDMYFSKANINTHKQLIIRFIALLHSFSTLNYLFSFFFKSYWIFSLLNQKHNTHIKKKDPSTLCTLLLLMMLLLLLLMLFCCLFTK